MSCCCRKKTAWLSRSENSATSTLAPVTSSRPDDWTCRMARWTTRWKPAVGDGSTDGIGLQRRQFGIEIAGELALEFIEIDAARLQHGNGMGVAGQGQQQMFERCIFMGAPRCFGERIVQGLFKLAGERGHACLRWGRRALGAGRTRADGLFRCLTAGYSVNVTLNAPNIKGPNGHHRGSAGRFAVIGGHSAGLAEGVTQE